MPSVSCNRCESSIRAPKLDGHKYPVVATGAAHLVVVCMARQFDWHLYGIEIKLA